jgi:hypothetical protein
MRLSLTRLPTWASMELACFFATGKTDTKFPFPLWSLAKIPPETRPFFGNSSGCLLALASRLRQRPQQTARQKQRKAHIP